MGTPLNQRRLTILGMIAIVGSVSGCAVFEEKPTPKLGAQLAPGGGPAMAPGGKYVVEIRPERGKPQQVERALTEPTYVQGALEQSGAIQRFGRMHVQLLRPLPAGGWHVMELEFDRDLKRIAPEYDYALLPGDRVVVTEDTTTVWDDVMVRALRPLGIQPPKKKDPVRQRYEIRG
jgi:hypothetical protein